MGKVVKRLARSIAEEILGRVETLSAIDSRGNCNQVFVAAGESRKIVIRLNADRANREFFKENWCMAQARAAGVSVASPLAAGVRDGWNFSVQTFEGGGHGSDVSDQLAVWRWLGESAALFHRIPVNGFGDMLVDEATGLFGGNWERYITNNLQSLTGETVLEELTPSQVDQLRHRFELMSETRFQFGLCHGDLSPRNVVTRDNQMTLIDWGCAHVHVVPHYDFWEILHDFPAASKEVHAFAEGYGLSAELDSLLPEIESVLLLCAFDLIRWARDRAPASLAEKKADFLKFLGRVESA